MGLEDAQAKVLISSHALIDMDATGVQPVTVDMHGILID